MTPLPALRHFIQLCDPNRSLRLELEEDLAIYVDLDDVRGPIRRPPGEQLLYLIQSSDPYASTAQLLVGASGSGKSTELSRLKRRIEESGGERTLVHLINLEGWLDLSSPFSELDLVRVLAESLELEVLGEDSAEPPQIQRWLLQQLTASPAFRNLGIGSLDEPLAMQLRQSRLLREQVDAILRPRAESVLHQLSLALERTIRRLRQIGVARLVVLVDGLDQVSPVHEAERAGLERGLERLLLDQAHLLHLPCHMVYTVPAWVMDREESLARAWSGGLVLLPTPDVGGPGRAEPEAVRRMEELVARRVDVDRLFGPDRERTLLAMILGSGGSPRDLLRLCRGAIERLGMRKRPEESPFILPWEARAAMDGMRAEYGVLVRRFGYDRLLRIDLARTDRQLCRVIDSGLLLWQERPDRRLRLHPLGWPSSVQDVSGAGARRAG